MKLKQLFKKYDWCQGELAYDDEGREVKPKNLQAKSFCLLGGIERCYSGKEKAKVKKKLYTFIKNFYSIQQTSCDDTVIEYNDEYAKKDDIIKLVNALDI